MRPRHTSRLPDRCVVKPGWAARNRACWSRMLCERIRNLIPKVFVPLDPHRSGGIYCQTSAGYPCSQVPGPAVLFDPLRVGFHGFPADLGAEEFLKDGSDPIEAVLAAKPVQLVHEVVDERGKFLLPL